MPENSENTAKVGKGHPPKDKQFKKGQTGNPNGRPRKLPALDTLMAEILGEETKGITVAQKILNKLKQKAASGDLKAAEMLLDRAYGKPKQVTEEIGDKVIRVKITDG